MIQDATGKFSSRCVLPDRSSLAVVIKNWLHWSGHGDFASLLSAHADRPQTPYRGIRYQNQCFLRLLANADCGQIERITGRSGDYWMRVRATARGFSAPDRRPWSIWDDVAGGKPGQ